ncbi:MAG: CBS domain-containing protein [Xanthomonadaceae bacterium]|nr:CBS domain-containing protein [Xanthomonadaceae bacterium]
MLPTDVTVDEFTTPEPVTATEDMSIEDLQLLMQEHGIRHLPVVRDENVVGVISDRDVRLVAGLSYAEKHQVRAGDIMTPDPLIVSATARLDDVALAMSERKVGSAIVTEADGKLLGIFTATDALNALIEIVRGGGASS